MQMTLAAVGRLHCGRAQTCYIGGFILFIYFFRVSNGRNPASANGPETLLSVFCHLFSMFWGFFSVVVGGPRGTMLTKQLYFHAVETILVSFGIHAAINGFYFCVTPKQPLTMMRNSSKGNCL